MKSDEWNFEQVQSSPEEVELFLLQLGFSLLRGVSMFGFSSIAIINDVAGLTTIQAEFVLNAIISFGLSEFSSRSRGSTDSVDFHGKQRQ